jgi:hypothetical protein
MLLLPLSGQYEQMMNARYVERLGLGVWSRQLDQAVLSRFLSRLDEPMPENHEILWPDNEKFFHILGGVLSRLDRPISVTPRRRSESR